MQVVVRPKSHRENGWRVDQAALLKTNRSLGSAEHARYCRRLKPKRPISAQSKLALLSLCMLVFGGRAGGFSLGGVQIPKRLAARERGWRRQKKSESLMPPFYPPAKHPTRSLSVTDDSIYNFDLMTTELGLIDCAQALVRSLPQAALTWMFRVFLLWPVLCVKGLLKQTLTKEWDSPVFKLSWGRIRALLLRNKMWEVAILLQVGGRSFQTLFELMFGTFLGERKEIDYEEGDNNINCDVAHWDKGKWDLKPDDSSALMVVLVLFARRCMLWVVQMSMVLYMIKVLCVSRFGANSFDVPLQQVSSQYLG